MTDPRTPEQIEADIAHQREQLADTVDQLATKLDVKAQARARVHTLQDRATTDSGSPRPEVLAAAGSAPRHGGRAGRLAHPPHSLTPTQPPKGTTMSKLLLLAVGAAGYVLGTRAGRERYEQIKGMAVKVKDDPRVQEKAHQATDLAKEKAPVVKDKVVSAAALPPAPSPTRSAPSPTRSARTRTRARSRTSSTPTTSRCRTTPTRRATCPDQRLSSAACRVTALASVNDATWSMTTRRRAASSAAASQSATKTGSRPSTPRSHSSSTSSATSSRWRFIRATRSSACMT